MRTNVQVKPAGSYDLAGRFLTITAAVLASLALSCSGEPKAVATAARGAEDSPAKVVSPTTDPSSIPLPSTPVAYVDTLAALDLRISAIRDRAASTEPSWLTLQTLADALGERAHLTGDYDDYAAAEAVFAQAFTVAAEGSGPFMSRAQLHFTLHRLAPALADLETASKRINLNDDEQAAIDGLRADIAFQRGDYPSASAEFERLAAAKPGLSTQSRLATYRWKTGDFDGADALYAETLRSYTGKSGQTRAWLRLMRGLLDLDRGRHQEAYAHYKNAAAEFSGYWLVEEHIAEIRTLLGETEPAKELYEDLITRTGNPEFMDALADLLEEQGDASGSQALRGRARKSYEELLARYPEAAAGHAIDHFLGDKSAAARALEIAEANHTLRPNGAAKILLARALLGAGELERAKATVEALLASPWRSAGLHEVASEVFAATGDQERAAAQLTKAKAIDPTIGG